MCSKNKKLKYSVPNQLWNNNNNNNNKLTNISKYQCFTICKEPPIQNIRHLKDCPVNSKSCAQHPCLGDDGADWGKC